jgi:hypothetical protein
MYKANVLEKGHMECRGDGKIIFRCMLEKFVISMDDCRLQFTTMFNEGLWRQQCLACNFCSLGFLKCTYPNVNVVNI